MKIKNQLGFGAIEAILILLVVGIIGGTGYYIYSENKEVKPVESSTDTNQLQKAEEKQKTEYIEFKELGVKIKKTDVLKDITYETDVLIEGEAPALHLTTPEFAELGAICWANDPVVGTKSFQTIQKKTTKYGSDGFIGSNLKQFDGFYIGANELTGFGCEEDSKAEEFKRLGESLNSTLNEAFKNAEKI